MRWKTPSTDIRIEKQNDEVFLNNAAVGAAIGRPPVNVRSDVKQYAGAKAIISNVTGRADAKTTISILNANRPCAEHRTSDARPYNNAVF